MQALIPLVSQELKKAAQSITSDELARAKAKLKAEFLMSMESSENRMNQLAKQIWLFDHFLEDQELLAKIDAVSQEEVYQFANGCLRDAEQLTLVSLGAIENVPNLNEIQACLNHY